MRKLFWQLNRWLLKQNFYKQIVFFYISSWVVTFLFMPLMYVSRNILGSESNKPDVNAWFFVIVVAPLIETSINQYGVYKICQKISYTKHKPLLVIFISALIFGLMHFYNLGYVFFGFAMGLVLAYVYYFYHKHPVKAFWATTLIHALRNTTAYLLALI